jgi:hypothetical protein
MNFILFNIILLFAGFLAVFIFSVGLMACVAPMALFAKSENPPKAFMLPLIGIAGIYQIYFWGFWSAFCVTMTIRFTQKPEVTWDWLYWITGFMECTSVIDWLAHKERQGSRSLAEVRGIQRGTMLYSLIAILAFLVFAFAPSLVLPPYGWALKPLGLAYDGLTILVAQGEAPPKEYVDHQYQFAFQFPADWQFEKNPPPGEAGEVRAIVRHPTNGHIGKTITKRQFESSPNRDAAVEAMIELSVEQIYKKTSRDIGAERMIVSEKRVQPSDAGIMFYLSTAHIKGSITMLMAGIHIVPFEKRYMITFTMFTPVDRTAPKDNEIITRVFNSFHILGERPIK